LAEVDEEEYENELEKSSSASTLSAFAAVVLPIVSLYFM